MMTTKELHEYIIRAYVTCDLWGKLNDVSRKMYFISLHIIDRGEY